MKKISVAITGESGGKDGEFFYRMEDAEDDPSTILPVLKERGLSYELGRRNTRIIEISRTWSGEGLLSHPERGAKPFLRYLYCMKISHDYELVPEDTPEPVVS